MNRPTLEEAYLDHILLHLASQDPDDRPLRTYVDSWFAHSRGDKLLERRIPRPQWLNTGDIAKRPELAKHCHAISRLAKERIEHGLTYGLVKDHVVPMAQLRSELKVSNFSNRADLRAFLETRYRVAIVTSEEHRHLSKSDKIRAARGESFGANSPAFARYDCDELGIEYYFN